MTPLERITERVNRNGDVNDLATPRPLLTLAEFFEGNDVVGSIGCNLNPPPKPATFHDLLKRIAARPEVADVRVQVTMFDDPAWPFSDTVWIITSAAPEHIAGWFEEEMRPDDCRRGWPPGVKVEPYALPAGMEAVRCFWD
ncbi:MAG: hypothetical protein L0Y71_03820 [Gemmataceae bacterium]|nr:hypothetical protein [Gemmataceae bacterium]